MRFKLNVGEYTIKNDYSYINDVLNEGKNFPILTIGRDSYIVDAIVDNALDKDLIYNLQIGRYSSIAHDVTFIIDMNHDFKKVCQGRINGIPYSRPELTRRKGQIIIMNDCWIGEKVTILSGVTIGNGAVVAANSVVSKDVPPYAIVAGNPAKVIGYRFNESQIEALLLIRWWNWSAEKVKECANELYGDIDAFIAKHIEYAKQELSSIQPASLQPIEKQNQGEEKRLLYIPDFEQDYPTYPRVIDAFAKSYADTNYELILYIKNDQLLEEKLSALNELFEQYEDVNCYINLFIENLTDERSLFGQADAYICNRSIDNITHIDMADLFQIPVISSVDIPIFTERKISSMTTIKETNKEETTDISTIKKLVQTVKAIKDTTTTLSSNLSQLSVNQYAMNCSIHNLKYELFADMEQPVYPKIAPGKEAIDTIINDHKSLCRLGDGEFAVIAGINRQKFQHADKKLALRLQEVLRSNDDNILLGIPDIYGDLSKYNDGCQYNIRTYLTPKTREEHYSLLDMNRTYYDAYLTRPYASYLDNNTDMPQKRFNHLKQIWDNRKLLIIEGAQTRMGIGNDLFDNASDIIRILGPAEHAFDRYDELLNTALQQDKSKLVLIALGPTATVLAYDLALAGFQALDIGHIDIEYEWMLAGSGTKFPVKGKYTNEATGGNIVEDIYDSAYEKQIIAKFY